MPAGGKPAGESARLWPYRPRTAFIAALGLLVVLLILLAIARLVVDWPAQETERFALLGIFILSLVPILLMFIDLLAERGAKVQYRDIVVDFSASTLKAEPGIVIPANIGVSGKLVPDSGTAEILSTLRDAVTSNVVLIDLEDGKAWWETRLLILLAGAVRLGQPQTVVFVATEGGFRQCFQGWGFAAELLPLVLREHPKYPLAYHAATAAARQWALVEPLGPNLNPPLPYTSPSVFPTGLAGAHPSMAFDNETGLPNPFLAEQLLASELAENVEQVEPPRTISVVRLEELFRPALRRERIDETWPPERQLAEFFARDSAYVALTRDGQFKSLVSRLSVLNAIVGVLAQRG
jgi:hypothetical protein